MWAILFRPHWVDKTFFRLFWDFYGSTQDLEWFVKRTCNEMRKLWVGPCLDLMGQGCTLWDTINIIVIRKRGRFHFTGLDHVYVWTGHIMTWSQISRLLHGPSLAAEGLSLECGDSTHYNDVIMSAMASQLTVCTNVYSTVYSDADQRKHQSSASLVVNSPHKGPVTRKVFPFDDVIVDCTE